MSNECTAVAAPENKQARPMGWAVWAGVLIAGLLPIAYFVPGSNDRKALMIAFVMTCAVGGAWSSATKGNENLSANALAAKQ